MTCGRIDVDLRWFPDSRKLLNTRQESTSTGIETACSVYDIIIYGFAGNTGSEVK